jgi:RHH-type proline utilization regulon transcriptional repressor/proline dehydrogenase/delta 1-pyrroline-5-carboxylate dehydrogenase
MQAPDAIDLAIASHNVRSIARALALREQRRLPHRQIEFQALYGMATPLVKALAERGERVRIYMPFGELIPGMAYLVRRLLENTSNESFLRRGFLENEPPEVLLADPATAGILSDAGAPSLVPVPHAGNGGAESRPAPRVSTERRRAPAPDGEPRDDGLPRGFVNEPQTDFSIAGARDRFTTALATVRRQFGRHYPLVIGGTAVDTAGQLASRNPSRPDEVVGTTASASGDDVDRAVAAAEQAFAAWRDAGAVARSDLLGRVANVMRESRDELAAWMVYEAGKPWHGPMPTWPRRSTSSSTTAARPSTCCGRGGSATSPARSTRTSVSRAASSASSRRGTSRSRSSPG